MTTEKLRYPQCRCARFGQSRFEPVRRTALDGKLWWCIVDHFTGEYDYSKFTKRRQALVHLAIELRHNRLPYDPDPGFGKKWIHERTAQEVAWLVDHRKLRRTRMKLNEFLDIADDDDMVEVYADDGVTRPCKIKLVDVFNVSDWVGGNPDVMDGLMLYLNREVTCVATVKLDVPEDGEIVAMRVYVEQEEGDENVQDEEEAQLAGTEDGQVKKELEGPARSAVCEHLGFAHSILCDLVTLVGSSATDTVSEESVEALIRTAIDRVQRAGKAIGFKLGEVE